MGRVFIMKLIAQAIFDLRTGMDLMHWNSPTVAVDAWVYRTLLHQPCYIRLRPRAEGLVFDYHALVLFDVEGVFDDLDYFQLLIDLVFFTFLGDFRFDYSSSLLFQVLSYCNEWIVHSLVLSSDDLLFLLG